MEFQQIFNEVFTKEKVVNILTILATQAENGNLKAIKMVVDYGFFPPQNKNGQLQLNFEGNKMTLEIVENEYKS